MMWNRQGLVNAALLESRRRPPVERVKLSVCKLSILEDEALTLGRTVF